MSRPHLAEKTGLAASSVRDALFALEEAGVVEQIGFQKSRLYRLSKVYPLLSAIEMLFRAEEDRFGLIRTSISKAARQIRGVRAVWIYGSVARSEDAPRSDLDLAIVTTASVARLTESFRDALSPEAKRLEFSPSVVGLRLTDIEMLIVNDDPWWHDVLRDGIPVYGPPPRVVLRDLQAAAAIPA